MLAESSFARFRNASLSFSFVGCVFMYASSAATYGVRRENIRDRKGSNKMEDRGKGATVEE